MEVFPLSVLAVFAAACGAILGSFLNVVVLRDVERRTIIAGRSHCMHCDHVLRWYELIPIVSWLIQGGRCRSCHHRISPAYLIAELVCAVMTAGIVTQLVQSGANTGFVLGTVIAFWWWFVVALQDVRTQMVRLEYIVIASIIGMLAGEFFAGRAIADVVYGAVMGGGTIAAIILLWYLVRREWGMGDGDIWIAAGLGALLGWQLALVMLVVATFSGTIGGVMTIAFTKQGMRSTIPFGPYLIFGAWVALLWGTAIVAWYTEVYLGALLW
jgi:leader peptidase (prepilin peptidase) / N-methyltransferase